MMESKQILVNRVGFSFLFMFACIPALTNLDFINLNQMGPKAEMTIGLFLCVFFMAMVFLISNDQDNQKTKLNEWIGSDSIAYAVVGVLLGYVYIELHLESPDKMVKWVLDSVLMLCFSISLLFFGYGLSQFIRSLWNRTEMNNSFSAENVLTWSPKIELILQDLYLPEPNGPIQEENFRREVQKKFERNLEKREISKDLSEFGYFFQDSWEEAVQNVLSVFQKKYKWPIDSKEGDLTSHFREYLLKSGLFDQNYRNYSYNLMGHLFTRRNTTITEKEFWKLVLSMDEIKSGSEFEQNLGTNSFSFMNRFLENTNSKKKEMGAKVSEGFRNRCLLMLQILYCEYTVKTEDTLAYFNSRPIREDIVRIVFDLVDEGLELSQLKRPIAEAISQGRSIEIHHSEIIQPSVQGLIKRYLRELESNLFLPREETKEMIESQKALEMSFIIELKTLLP